MPNEHCTPPGAAQADPAGKVRTPHRARTHYVDEEALATLIRRYRQTGTVSEDLALAITAIAGGVWDRYRYTTDRDDFIQDCYLHVTKARGTLDRVNPNQRPFGYLTQACKWLGLTLRQNAREQLGREVQYPAELLDAEPLAGRAVDSSGAAEDPDPLEWHPTHDDTPPAGPDESETP